MQGNLFAQNEQNNPPLKTALSFVCVDTHHLRHHFAQSVQHVHYLVRLNENAFKVSYHYQTLSDTS